ncbi:MAG TPA: ComF family protein [Gemmataceae bacterium]|jgi:ComF family protein|nr:ComF family protein [Gemmataceae bacterium]
MFRHVANLGRDLASGLLELLYPASCAACGRSLPAGGTGFCGPCRAALTADLYPACPRCGGTVGPYALVEGGCSRCRQGRFQFDAVLRFGPYEGLLRELVLRLKHHSGEALGEGLGRLWAEHAQVSLRGVGAGVVIPVPLHWWRRWCRGYNQSEVLAHALADGLGLPCRPRFLRRIRNTPEQTRQTPSGRRDNVRGAFRVRRGTDLRGRSVLLVDDVLTTGSTCSEAAGVLRVAGAARVTVAVLARSQA